MPDLLQPLSIIDTSSFKMFDIAMKVALVLALAGVLCWMLRRNSAAMRHLVWTFAVLAALLLPPTVALTPKINLALLPAIAQMPINRIATNAASTTLGTDRNSKVQYEQNFAPTGDSLKASASLAPRNTTATLSSNPSAGEVGRANATTARSAVDYKRVALVVWFIGVIIVAVPFLTALVVHWLRSFKLKRIDDEEWTLSVSTVSKRLRLVRSVRSFESKRAIVPATFGVLRPYLVVPPDWSEWSDEHRRCILLHELAHVKRFDVATQFIARIVAAVYWFNPLAWYAVRQLRIERELACDDRVLGLGLSASEYATVLLQTLQQARTERFTVGTAMAHSARLDERVDAILDQSRCRLEPSATAFRVCLLLAGFVTIGLGTTSFVTRAAVAAPQTSETDNGPQATQKAPAETPKANVENAAELPANFAIEGICLDGDNKSLNTGNMSPVAGVTLTLFQVRGLTREIRKLSTTTTGESGRYRFDDLEPMDDNHLNSLQYYVTAKADGWREFAKWYYVGSGQYPVLLSPHWGKLKGRVVDQSGEAVENAIIQQSSLVPAENIELTTTRSNREGYFFLNQSPVVGTEPGMQRAAYVQIRHPDYPWAQTYKRDSLAFSTFVLKPGCTIAGSVIVDTSGLPLPNAVVSVYPTHAGGVERTAHTTTNSNGKFRLNVNPGTYNLVLEEDDDYVAEAVSLECRRGQPVELEQPLRAIRGGWIVGQVTNTDTGQPMIVSDGAAGTTRHVSLGLYGPSRPTGNVHRQHPLVRVDANGRYRLRAFPGANYPYLTNLRGSRMAWDTKKQPAVVVEAGKETECEITYTPPRTPADKMAKAREILDGLPLELDARVAGIITALRRKYTVGDCEIWCSMTRELVTLGKPAVPVLCEELRSTSERRMMQRLVFALRAIGDPRAVPTLIRVLPKTLTQLGDYGLIVEDGELTRFMQEHDLDSGNGGTYFHLHSLVREMYGALNKLTNRNVNVEPLKFSRSSDLRSLARQEKIYDDAAHQWATWWEANWHSFGVPEEFSNVDLPEFVPRDLSAYPTGLELTTNAIVDGGVLGMVLTAIGEYDRHASFFLDLDTKRSAKWPKELDADNVTVRQATDWAAGLGFDLACVAEPNEDGTPMYSLLGIGLQLWEIDPLDGRKIESFVADQTLPVGRLLDGPELLSLDDKSQKPVSLINSTFLFVTREEGLGMIKITDFVTKAQDITGMMSAPEGVGFHRGVRFDYKQIAR